VGRYWLLSEVVDIMNLTYKEGGLAMRKYTVLLLMVAVVAAVAGCQSNTVTVARPTGELAAESVDSAELAYKLSSQKWCSNDQGCSMVLLLVEGEDRYTSFEQRLAALESKGFADGSWNLQEEEPVNKGTLAYMLCRGLGIKGGVMMQLIGGRRYAYREAIFQGLMLRGSENEPLTGPEVVGIMGRSSRIKEKL
jgi:hypothetical protein